MHKEEFMHALETKDYSTVKLEDAVVIRRVVAGEKELFEILLRRYNRTLFRVIRGYLKDEFEIQDAMQNAYLKAFDKLSQFQGNSAFSTWLIRIGINEALLRLKGLKRGRMISLNSSSMDEERIRQIPDRQMNPEKRIIRQESQQILEHAIDSLPEKYRIVYMLKEVEGLSNDVIADTLNITDSNIKIRLHRAKAMLKDSLYKLSTPTEVFEFGNHQCDAMVAFVMNTI